MQLSYNKIIWYDNWWWAEGNVPYIRRWESIPIRWIYNHLSLWIPYHHHQILLSFRCNYHYKMISHNKGLIVMELQNDLRFVVAPSADIGIFRMKLFQFRFVSPTQYKCDDPSQFMHVLLMCSLCQGRNILLKVNFSLKQNKHRMIRRRILKNINIFIDVC